MRARISFQAMVLYSKEFNEIWYVSLKVVLAIDITFKLFPSFKFSQKLINPFSFTLIYSQHDW